ncbi:MAG: endonuclease domain-containing protein, partial [Stackebrandtia sp.]
LFDCARTLPRLDAVAAVDRLLRFDLDPVACGRLYRQLLNEPDAVRMRSALAVRDVRSQSPLESWGRCLVQDAGLPRPTPQLPAPVAGGRTMHLDLGYKAFRLGVEFDGFQHHSKPADVAYDRRRRGLLVDSGWHVAVFTGSTVLNDPEAMLSAILDLLLERGWRPPSRQLARIRKRIRHVAACMEAGHDTW